MNILIQLLRDNSDALDDLQFNPQKMSVLTNGTSIVVMPEPGGTVLPNEVKVAV